MLPFMRLLVNTAPPMFWNACRLPPMVLALAAMAPWFDSNCRSPLMRAREMLTLPPCTSCTEPPKVE